MLLNVANSEMGSKALKNSFVLGPGRMELDHVTHQAMEGVMVTCHGARPRQASRLFQQVPLMVFAQDLLNV